jgi:hypothetical protein
MAYRLKISPEGVCELTDASLTSAQAAGRNHAVVRNDHYEVAYDGLYTNTE